MMTKMKSRYLGNEHPVDSMKRKLFNTALSFDIMAI